MSKAIKFLQHRLIISILEINSRQLHHSKLLTKTQLINVELRMIKVHTLVYKERVLLYSFPSFLLLMVQQIKYVVLQRSLIIRHQLLNQSLNSLMIYNLDCVGIIVKLLTTLSNDSNQWRKLLLPRTNRGNRHKQIVLITKTRLSLTLYS